jgi:DNA-binding transcriptional MerR regulator
MAARNYQSIGEVLVSLKTEFPDITISKIRFLEAEGLIAPERTTSGYRKFFETDVEKLRSILKMQRDEYLPLKVIKDRILKAEAEGTSDGPGEPVEDSDELADAPTGLQMSIEEMSSATGVEKEQILELESFAIICSHGPEAAKYYDGDDYVVLSVAKEFLKYGIQPRHLRMYKNFEEREASLFESVVLPMMRQKNPDARKAATDSLHDLARLSKKFKQALLRIYLHEYLSG